MNSSVNVALTILVLSLKTQLILTNLGNKLLKSYLTLSDSDTTLTWILKREHRLFVSLISDNSYSISDIVIDKPQEKVVAHRLQQSYIVLDLFEGFDYISSYKHTHFCLPLLQGHTNSSA